MKWNGMEQNKKKIELNGMKHSGMKRKENTVKQNEMEHSGTERNGTEEMELTI